MTVQTVTLSDSIKVHDLTPSFIKANAIALAEMVTLGNTISRQHSFVSTLSELIRVHSTLVAGQAVSVSLFDTTDFTDDLTTAVREILQSAVGLTSRLSAHQALVLRERLAIASRLIVDSFYSIAIRDAVLITATGPSVQFADVLRSRVAIAANMTSLYRGLATVADEVAITDALAPLLVAVVVLEDGVTLSGQELLQGLYNATLSDTIEFTFDTISPNGDVTTWAMNTRTGAVTEYTGFDFNSFAKAANGTYLGANSDGLFTLVGDTDDGTPIIADLVSGLTNFGGAYLTSFKAAYLGIRGQGQFFLKLVDGGGRIYTYRLQASSLRTSRVNIGKGLRAKYFSWQLISTGQDFDLNEVTFLPIQQTRRV